MLEQLLRKIQERAFDLLTEIPLLTQRFLNAEAVHPQVVGTLSPTDLSVIYQLREMLYNEKATTHYHYNIIKLYPLDQLPPLIVAHYRLSKEELIRLFTLMMVGNWQPITELLHQHTDPQILQTFVLKLLASAQEPTITQRHWIASCANRLGGALVVPALLRLPTTPRQYPPLATLLNDNFSALAKWHLLVQYLDTDHWEAFPYNFEKLCASEKLASYQLIERFLPPDTRLGSTFDYQGERYSVRYKIELTPMLYNSQGKVCVELPTSQTPTEQMIKEEWEEFCGYLYDLKRLLDIALEHFMIEEERWTPPEWTAKFLQPPYWRYLAPTVIWGAYDEAQRLLLAFRVAEDYTYSNCEDRTVQLPAATTAIGVVHPLHLSYAEREQWQQLLIDYEIIAPFQQMSRSTHSLLDSNVVPSGAGVIFYPRAIRQIPQPSMIGLASFHGWQYDPMQRSYWRTFSKQHITAQIQYSSHRRRVKLCSFTRDNQVIPVQYVSPVILSETLHVLQRLVK